MGVRRTRCAQLALQRHGVPLGSKRCQLPRKETIALLGDEHEQQHRGHHHERTNGRDEQAVSDGVARTRRKPACPRSKR